MNFFTADCHFGSNNIIKYWENIMNFFTADCHFGSNNIIKYCDRPFKNSEHMTKRLVNEINQKCHRPEDTLTHIGDFVLYGKERGVENTRIKASVYEDMIKPKLTHILGNHDLNNGVKGSILGASVKIGKKIAWLQHYPPWYDNHIAPTGFNVYLCGHVHRNWKYKTYKNKLVINVGVDVNFYRPVSTQDIIRAIEKFNNGKLI